MAMLLKNLQEERVDKFYVRRVVFLNFLAGQGGPFYDQVVESKDAGQVERYLIFPWIKVHINLTEQIFNTIIDTNFCTQEMNHI
eukprot:TRINITY_DN4669_c0_g1_i1.p1 TRINITY_DN4669_c0_g1~~TRINITY_DN4669_c0_g1_i1.p1  ORF type:complete len:84 (+),score=14.66 TRINITY_DN4669_c0_g1_i1:307-558(+)